VRSAVANQFARDSLVLIASSPVQRLEKRTLWKKFFACSQACFGIVIGNEAVPSQAYFLHACHTGANLMLRLKSSISSAFFTWAIFSFDDAR